MKNVKLSRRSFIGGTAAFVATPLILPPNVFGANKKLNIGFIGMGGVMGGM